MFYTAGQNSEIRNFQQKKFNYVSPQRYTREWNNIPFLWFCIRDVSRHLSWDPWIILTGDCNFLERFLTAWWLNQPLSAIHDPYINIYDRLHNRENYVSHTILHTQVSHNASWLSWLKRNCLPHRKYALQKCIPTKKSNTFITVCAVSYWYVGSRLPWSKNFYNF